jgi:hypothetical protein
MAVQVRGRALAKRKPDAGKTAVTKSIPPPPPDAFSNTAPSQPDPQIETGGLSLHDLFSQQAMKMLDRTDLSEEQKQSVLVAMNCPCCGAGGMSFTAKLKRRR